jgi:acetylornithine/succinyldiaminopimelate/putrescine aminotransferase
MLDLAAGQDARAVVERAARDGVLLTPWSSSRIRAVTHLDVSEAEVIRAAEVVVRAISELAPVPAR